MKYVSGALIAVILLLIGAAIFLYGGCYNVAANVPHWNITTWFMKEVRDRSIAYHSKGIQAPSLKDLEWVKAGFNHYHAMCRLCHGAPGQKPPEFAQGLYPEPPDLTSEKMKELSEAELYWVVKNGIKMTGMPAFGPTHDEDEVWTIVAFLRNLPKLKAEEYQKMSKSRGQAKEEEEHHHPAVKKH